MSRSGYNDDFNNLWRGAVKRAINGRRGQEFLAEMLAALDAMSQKRLIADDLEVSGEVCAIGSVGIKRAIDMSGLDPHCPEQIANAFGIAPALVQEIEWMNDEWYWNLTPEARWAGMRRWIVENLKAPTP